MGRPSKLTDKQWAEVERRKLDGESYGKLAAEFGVTPGAIKQQISARINSAKTIAKQMVETEREFEKLPITTQRLVTTLAQRLRSISDHLGAAAEFGAMTSHRLASIAHTETNKIDDTAVMDNVDALKSISILTDMSNKAAQTALSLMAANARNPEPPDSTITLINAPDA